MQILRTGSKAATIALFGGLLPVSARAADYPVRVDCPWKAEAVAQVEARIRTTLLSEGLDVREVSIACAPGDTASVFVKSENGALLRPVVRKSQRIEDDVVGAVEAALRELIPPSEPEPPAVAPPAAMAPAPAAPASTAAPPARLERPVPRATDAAAPRRPERNATPAASVTELNVAPVVERLGGKWATGADAGMSVGDGSLAYGLAFGARAALGEPSTFDVTDWSAGAHLSLTLPRAYGLRFKLGIGVSLLVATPATKVVPDSSTLLSAGSLNPSISRPFWFGAFALAPGVGARVFSARRNVRVNEHEQFALPIFAPHVELSLIYRR